jgi:hypothetical protein
VRLSPADGTPAAGTTSNVPELITAVQAIDELFEGNEHNAEQRSGISGIQHSKSR